MREPFSVSDAATAWSVAYMQWTLFLQQGRDFEVAMRRFAAAWGRSGVMARLSFVIVDEFETSLRNIVVCIVTTPDRNTS